MAFDDRQPEEIARKKLISCSSMRGCEIQNRNEMNVGAGRGVASRFQRLPDICEA